MGALRPGWAQPLPGDFPEGHSLDNFLLTASRFCVTLETQAHPLSRTGRGYLVPGVPLGGRIQLWVAMPELACEPNEPTEN